MSVQVCSSLERLSVAAWVETADGVVAPGIGSKCIGKLPVEDEEMRRWDTYEGAFVVRSSDEAPGEGVSVPMSRFGQGLLNNAVAGLD